MLTLPANLPVIAGIGFHQERSEDPARCSEPYQLMARAARNAAAAAGSDELLGRIESVSVPLGMWQYRNPGRLVAGALGCPGAGRYEVVTEAVANVDGPLPLNGEYTGPATNAGYTVVFNRDQLSHAIAICDTPAGERTVARSEDGPLLAAMMGEEFCGRAVEIMADGTFASTSA